MSYSINSERRTHQKPRLEKAMAGTEISNTTEMARAHIEEIRKQKFSIGEKVPNPLVIDLQNAILNLSSELYAKDIHFIMELIQNAEDNGYSPGVEPTLEFVLTGEDVTGTGALATLLVFNNEIGFSKQNVESICSIGRSTKKGQRNKGFIGEKGIGFKSVFLVSEHPYVFSNGYQIKFSEAPSENCHMGYIVPEWVDTRPTISDLQIIYGDKKALPRTTIVLPLKPGKLENVKNHLSDMHPEILLFLHKIRRLSVRICGISQVADSESEISILTETTIGSPHVEGTDSRIVRLSSQGSADKIPKECHYFIYGQLFPVKQDCVVDSRRDIKEWSVLLAFPLGDRLRSGSTSVGIFSFLPTSMVTNFPFIVQADFILGSSREAILLDNKWNLGILDCVPAAFVSALVTCTKSTEMAKHLPITRLLELFPLQEAPLKQLNSITESIKRIVSSECIVPCQSLVTEEIVFCKPCDVVRIFPSFRDILSKSTKHPAIVGKFILHGSVEGNKYNKVWDFLGVQPAKDCYDWHAEYIAASNFLSHASVELYVEILCFLARHWSKLPQQYLSSIPLLKYVAWSNQVLPCTISDIKNKRLKIHLIWEPAEHKWLNEWSVEMHCPGDMFFLHVDTISLIHQKSLQDVLSGWLTKTVGLKVTGVFSYCSVLCTVPRLQRDPRMALLLAHLVYHASCSSILESMPVVDDSGNVQVLPSCLVPSSSSKWMKLFGSSNVAGMNYTKLGKVYAEGMEVCGCHTGENDLLDFLVEHKKAVDLPNIFPEDIALGVASNQLTSDQVFLLLEWIKTLKSSGCKIPPRFLASIQTGKWMKTYSGFSSPTCCYLYDGTGSTTLAEIGKSFKVLSAIDERYYEDKIRMFGDELRFIGVKSCAGDMYRVIIQHLTTLVSSALSRDMVISLLRFIRYAKKNNKLDGNLLKAAQQGKWLKTDRGYVSPVGVAYLASGTAEPISQITDLRIVDSSIYDNDLKEFVDELKLLGVLVSLEDIYKQIPQHFRLPEDPRKLTRASVLLLLKCIRKLGSAAAGLIGMIRERSWMRTSTGFASPTKSLLRDRDWDILLNIVPLHVVDEGFYGKEINSYKPELEAIGVAVDLDKAYAILIHQIQGLISSNSMKVDIVVSILSCMKFMSEKMPMQLPRLVSCLSEGKWLKTSNGYKAACASILFDSKWETISQFVDLPFIDVAFYGSAFASFKAELKRLGVVVEFKEGAHLVAHGLQLPKNPTSISADCGLSFLHCARSLRLRSDHNLLQNFVNKLKGSAWLKTHMGFRTPGRTLIFNPQWKSYLEEKDGPFVDQDFYGTLSVVELNELKAMGAVTDTNDICSSLFEALTSHKDTSIITRIYGFLHKHKWSFDNPTGSCSPQLWIPGQPGSEGKWVDNSACVLHDKEKLFGSSLHILDKYYSKNLLPFLSKNLGVEEFPSISRCVDLWNKWENTKHPVSSEELHYFWGFLAEQWNPKTEEVLKSSMTMLPAATASGKIHLVNRAGVLIPDDLQLRKSFSEAEQEPLFVWFPQNGSSSVTKQYEIYRSLGVRKLSESVEFSLGSESSAYKKLDCKGNLIGKPLIKIVLAFLANPLVSMPVEVRHKIVKSLLDISVLGTDQPLMVTYVVHLPSSGKKLKVQSEKLVVWDRDWAALEVHKPSWENGTKNVEFIADFARAVSEVVLSDSVPGLVDELRKIIKMGLAFGLKEGDVDSLLRTENLELFDVDNDFLGSAFSTV